MMGSQEHTPWVDFTLGSRATRNWPSSCSMDSELLCRWGKSAGDSAYETKAARRGWVELPGMAKGFEGRPGSEASDASSRVPNHHRRLKTATTWNKEEMNYFM